MKTENTLLEVTRFHWDPFTIVEVADHEMRLRNGSAITVLKESERSTVLRSMAERGWLDAPEFVVALEALSDEERYVLEGLKQSGAILQVPSAELPAVISEFYARSGGQVDAQEIASRLEYAVVRVVGDHVTFIEAFLEALDVLGIGARKLEALDSDSVRRFGDHDVVVAAYRDLFSDVASRHNELLIRSGFPGRILFVGGFDGRQSVVGPWVLAHKSACLACWNLRRRANLIDIPSTVRPGSASESSVTPYYGTRSVLQSYERLVASYVADIVAEYTLLEELAPSAQPGSYRSIGFSRNGIEIERHHVLKVPRCAVCGTVQSMGFPQVWHHGR